MANGWLAEHKERFPNCGCANCDGAPGEFARALHELSTYQIAVMCRQGQLEKITLTQDERGALDMEAELRGLTYCGVQNMVSF